MPVYVVVSIILSIVAFLLALVNLFMYVHVYMMGEHVYNKYFPQFVREFRHQDYGDLHRRLIALEVTDKDNSMRHRPYTGSLRKMVRFGAESRRDNIESDSLPMSSSSGSNGVFESDSNNSLAPGVGSDSRDTLSTTLSNTSRYPVEAEIHQQPL